MDKNCNEVFDKTLCNSAISRLSSACFIWDNEKLIENELTNDVNSKNNSPYNIY